MARVKKHNEKKISNKPFDFILCIAVLLLLALGIVMVLSASAPSALSKYGNSYTYVEKQAILGLVGIVAMFIISKIDYRKYKKFYKIAYIGSIFILAIVPIIGKEVNGAKRWIDLGFTTFQPSELAKLGLIIFFAAILSNNKDRIKHIWYGFLRPFVFLAPVALILLLFQDHFSATLIIVVVVSIMMLIAGSRLTYFLTIGLAGAVGGIALLFTKGAEFRMDRITAFLDPWADPTGDSWQMIQSLYAIGSGGLFGVGLGQSKQKYLYISEPHNDFIFAVLSEELGLVGCAIVIILFAIFIWRGAVIAMRAPDTFGSLVAVGITSLIGLQAVINIAVVTGSIPVTGMPLPFFSYRRYCINNFTMWCRNITKHIKA